MTRFDGKTTRRRIKKLRIDEASIVDMPAQAPARIAIMKSAAPTAPDALGILQGLAHDTLCKFAERDAGTDETPATAYARLWNDPRADFLVKILSN